MAFLYSTLQLHPPSLPQRVSPNVVEFRIDLGFGYSYQNLSRKNVIRQFLIRASGDDDIRVKVESIGIKVESKQFLDINDAVARLQDSVRSIYPVIFEPENKPAVIVGNAVSRLQESIQSLPPVTFMVKRLPGNGFAIGLCVVAMLLVIARRVHVIRQVRDKRPGSVADLVRRGQLRSDRRGMYDSDSSSITKAEPLKFEDPFNNPLVKVSKSNSTVEMCGKVYRLAQVTLTREQQTIHQKRRSRAYQWKRPITFLKEGEEMPSDVDPDTVRWIPANHPFATTVSDIDENLAQNNVYQKHGVPFRIQAEHEALQRKIEALQSEQRFNNLVVDSGTARNFERPYKSNLKEDGQQIEHNFSNGQVSPPNPQQSDTSSSLEEKQTP